MDKLGLIRETAESVRTLCERVNTAGVASSVPEGTYHHEIAYGMAMPLTEAARYFRVLVGTIENAEAKKKYGIMSPLKWLRSMRAAKVASDALNSLPSNQIQEVNDDAKEALGGNLEEAVAYFAHTLSHKRGQKMTEDDRAAIKPVMKVMEVLQGYLNLKDAYALPAF